MFDTSLESDKHIVIQFKEYFEQIFILLPDKDLINFFVAVLSRCQQHGLLALLRHQNTKQLRQQLKIFQPLSMNTHQ